MPARPDALSDDLIRKYIIAFHKYDKDADGFLSRKELVDLAKEVDISHNEEELLRYVTKLNLDPDSMDKTGLLQLGKIMSKKDEVSPGIAMVTSQMHGMNPKAIASRVGDWLLSTQETTSLWGGAEKAISNTLTRTSLARKPKPEIQKSAEDSKPVIVQIDEGSDSDYDFYTYSSEDENEDLMIQRGSRRRSTFEVPAFRRKSLNVPPEAAEMASRYISEQKKKLQMVEDALVKENRKAKAEIEKLRRSKRKMKHASEMIEGRRYKNEFEKAAAQEREKKIKAKLTDPKVRRQLPTVNSYNPYFFQALTLIQVVMLVVSLLVNQGIQDVVSNPMLGPSKSTLLRLGAKYGPCMRKSDIDPQSTVNCTIGYPPNNRKDENGQCYYYDDLAFQCGMGGFGPSGIPDQWFRIITNLFLHNGILHLGLNIIVQVTVGFYVESHIGSTRMCFIYIMSGLCGALLSMLTDPRLVSVGSSGALYGLFACLYLDLIQSWNILGNPKRYISLLTAGLILAFVVGLFPILDIFSLIGGFIGGGLTALLVMPQVSLGKLSKNNRKVLMAISFPLLVIFLTTCFVEFYNGAGPCEWCSRMNCVLQGSDLC